MANSKRPRMTAGMQASAGMIRSKKQRSGGPSMDVPGSGDIAKAKLAQQSNRDARSAAHYADAMSSIGGRAKPAS